MTRDLSIRLTLLVVVYTCYTVVGVNAQWHNQFIQTPPNYKEVLLGQDVQLPCKVNDANGYCRWLKGEKLLTMQPGKYELMQNNNNDCILLIKNASLDLDDDYWNCQVMSNQFKPMNAFKTFPSKLLVIVKPDPPILMYRGVTPIDNVITLKEGQQIAITCIVNHGNPPGIIMWFVGESQVEPLTQQKIIQEMDKPKTWEIQSTLELKVWKENPAVPIRCVSRHPSSSSQALVQVWMNVV